MKTLSVIVMLSICLQATINAQTYKKDTRSQIQKEDSYNKWQSEEMTTQDLLHALSIAGIRIHKFDLGEFDKKYDFYVIVDEFVEGKIVKTDTILNETNEYTSPKLGEKGYYTHYIDQLKLISRDDETKSQVKFFTYFVETRTYDLVCKKNKKNQFYAWRDFGDTSWKLNQKIPVAVFASSWEDKKYNVQRFCGVVKLEDGEKQTEELLTSSPHYYRISYAIK
jgi:Domain of unknown function (DUF5041)